MLPRAISALEALQQDDGLFFGENAITLDQVRSLHTYLLTLQDIAKSAPPAPRATAAAIVPVDVAPMATAAAMSPVVAAEEATAAVAVSTTSSAAISPVVAAEQATADVAVSTSSSEPSVAPAAAPLASARLEPPHTAVPEEVTSSLNRYDTLRASVPGQLATNFMKTMGGKSKKTGNATTLVDARRLLEIAHSKVAESIAKDKDDAPLFMVELSAKLVNGINWCRALVFCWAMQTIIHNPQSKKQDASGKVLRDNLLTLMTEVTTKVHGDRDNAAALIDDLVLEQARELLEAFPTKAASTAKAGRGSTAGDAPSAKRRKRD